MNVSIFQYEHLYIIVLNDAIYVDHSNNNIRANFVYALFIILDFYVPICKKIFECGQILWKTNTSDNIIVCNVFS